MGTVLRFNRSQKFKMKVPMDGVGSRTVKGLADAFADVLLDEKGVSPALRES
ncbi:hypothetical protein ACHAWF_000446, partial [Thalassiosira exigua]